MENSIICSDEWKEDIILKLNYIGYSRPIKDLITDLPGILEWLCKKFNFTYITTPFTTIKTGQVSIIALVHGKEIVSKYFIDNSEKSGISVLLVPEILKFWKCIDGVLEGPDWSIYITPQEDWT